MTSELKPCKTCGMPAEVKPPGSQRARCSDSSGECPDSRHFVSFDEWNRRAPSAAVARLVEALRGAMFIKSFSSPYALFKDYPEVVEALAAVEKEIGQ